MIAAMARHLHFDCFSGVSGDMVLGALVDAGLPFADLVRGLKTVHAKGYRLRAHHVRRAALPATKVDVLIRDGFRRPLSFAAIKTLIASSRLPEPVKRRSTAVFSLLANAEGIAHGVKTERVRFHEVGVVDSIVDVIGGVLGCHLLGVDSITASSINLGAGTIDTSHGTLPVPGPAVAALVRGLPVYSDGPARELSTPTGVALMKTLASHFGPLPPLRVTATGYGAGTADPHGWPNVLRVFIGESDAAGAGRDVVMQLETNLDDVNPQIYELVMERLFAAGALDVALTPVIMKRGRPGIVLTALTPTEKADAAADVLLQETTALGVRMQSVARRVLARRFEDVRIPGGTVRIKVAEIAPDRRKAAPEYADCRRIAEQTGRPVKDILEQAMAAWRATSPASGTTRRPGRR